jgi:hypothetical protein
MNFGQGSMDLRPALGGPSGRMAAAASAAQPSARSARPAFEGEQT